MLQNRSHVKKKKKNTLRVSRKKPEFHCGESISGSPEGEPHG